MHGQPNADTAMIAKVLADPGQRMAHGYTEATQGVGGTDTRQHKELRRGDCASANDNVSTLHGKLFIPTLDFHAYCLQAIKQDAGHVDVSLDGKITPVAIRVDIGESRALADAAHLVFDPWANAGEVGVIDIGMFRESCGEGGFVVSLGEVMPGCSFQPVNANWTICSMIRWIDRTVGD